jgi:hypothetical protein
MLLFNFSSAQLPLPPTRFPEKHWQKYNTLAYNNITATCKPTGLSNVLGQRKTIGILTLLNFCFMQFREKINTSNASFVSLKFTLTVDCLCFGNWAKRGRAA